MTVPEGTDTSAQPPTALDERLESDPYVFVARLHLAMVKATQERDDARAEVGRLRRVLRRAQSAATEMLRREMQHSGHGRDGHLNEDDIAVIYAALASDPSVPFDARTTTAGEPA